MAAEVLERIHSLERFGSVMGLERLRELLKRLGDPQMGLGYIHIAGTNGKGSVCKFLEKGLASSGYRVGMYISPYIEVFNERIQFDGKYITDEELDRYGNAVLDEIDAMTAEGMTSPTEFEAVMAMAFMYFAEKKPDLVILETGLGGIGDATNIIRDPMACVITSVSYDHMDVLGDSLEEIALNKAGIIKDGAPVISNVAEEGPASVIAKKAGDEGCLLYDVSKIKTKISGEIPGRQKVSLDLWGTYYKDVIIPMSGKHQAENLKTALAVIEVLRRTGKIKVDDEKLYAGLEEAVNPGRFEVISTLKPMIIIDGAHNEAGAEALKETARSILEGKRILMVIGMLKDKDIDGILTNFRMITDDFVVTSPDNPRKLHACELAEGIRDRGGKVLDVIDEPGVCLEKAMEAGKNYDVVLFAGSLYLIGDIRRMIRNGEKSS